MTGVWTLEAEEKRKKSGKSSRKRSRDDADNATAPTTTPMPFDKAQPTLTHRALFYLWKEDQKRSYFVVTQNVDGLHRRSGFPRRALAVLHGCVFTEKCEGCGREYFCDKQIQGISFQRTGNVCTACKEPLRDTLLDWRDHLPEDDWNRSLAKCDEADLIITLGTSLRMEPAASLVTHGKRYVIVNLQVSPYDEGAALVIRARVDVLLPRLLQALGYPDDWETAHPNPPIERESESICPKYSSRWWKPPTDEEEEEEEEE